MDQFVAQLAAKAGVDRAVAEKSIGIVLGFMRDAGPSDKVETLIEKIPGADRAVQASLDDAGPSALMGGGLLAVGTRLMGLGLGITDIHNVARELIRLGRDMIGAEQMGEIVAGTPGLSQFA